MPPIDIDGDAAHDAAQRELAKPIYPKASLTDQLSDWIDDLIYRLASQGATVPGGWLTISVLGVLLVLAVLIAIRTARRAVRTSRGRDPALFDTHTMTAAEHRRAAERSAADGDWAAAIRHRLRAVARRLEETGVLDPVPGRTATELARDAGRELPHLGTDLTTAATAFNDVTYGERPGTESAYRAIADLDEHLGARAPAADPDVPAPAAPAAWAEVR
ncbi:protein of unknown function [Mycolicibacterium rutilum]|uniref:Protein-glutamine gamma-glutamyltransferase-like C-terminal domain-containing protein n=1 Tax=Mycolicibacterium rutilum TaxID=370526 RepID=A0A1H6JI38_MYCRU|nr:DUF4129 domain-containing protein [Mycolicibacterium rutilum]SEH60100.1 protein of unknown function [Mycolicibacterium rutilum]